MKRLFIAFATVALLSLMSGLSFTQTDTDILARVIEAEAGGESYQGKLAVGVVVLNRLGTGKWGDSIKEVVLAEGQFATPKKKASKESRDAAQAALDGETNLPSFILFFQKAKVERFYGEWYTTIGCHNFYGDRSNQDD